MMMFNQDIPNFVHKELEKINEVLSPITKKVAKYRLWSFPLICISLINLYLMVMMLPSIREVVPTIILYAVLGAIGMALGKEAKHYQLQLQTQSTEYIIKRINESDIESDQIKARYTRLINDNPKNSMNYFIEFLQKENSHRNGSGIGAN
ncbi:DUF5392 family protein [Litchfieldia alkalitelluris]|uniref:DUF5392 family protein n=1 Tax=Litchfieldia alkalitelluris TaxID=304268 RepID=UPI000998CBA9|nr:DUF5392 family protein [Litchfieldia alkalitelluris]